MIINGTVNGDTLTGTADADEMYGFEGDDTLEGGDGDDILNGGAGTDQARYGGSSMDYTVFWANNGQLCVQAGATFELDLLCDIESIYFSGDAVTVTLADIPPLGTALDDTIAGTARHDWLSGLGGDDVLSGGLGNDILDGADGDDTYVYNLGDGNDTTYEWGGFDVVELGAGIDPNEVTVALVGDDNSYLLTFADGGTLLLDLAVDPYSEIEEIHFADSTVWTPADLEARAFGGSGTAASSMESDMAFSSGASGHNDMPVEIMLA